MKLRLLGLLLCAALLFPAFSGADVTVYVGYADGLRGGADFPNPFSVGGTIGGATVTNYFGNVCGGCDTGTIMIVNNGLSAVSIDGLSVNDRANGVTYAIWGPDFSFSLAPNTAAIFLENSGNNFDSSDFGGNTNITGIAGFDPSFNNCSTGAISLLPTCVNNSPIVTFTLNGASTDFTDSAHVLDTGGYDSAGYNHIHTGGSGTPEFNTNESLNWRVIGTTGINNPGGSVPEPSSLVLLGVGLVGLGRNSWKRFIA